jgi:hypothetical protein
MLWLLGTAIAAGVLSAARPRSRWHWVLGTLSLAALLAAVLAEPSAEGANWVVQTAGSASVVVNAIGLLMLLARGHPRRRHRHIIYCGYGVVFTAVALVWALAGEHALAALVASVGVYVLGSLAIGLYKARHTRGTLGAPAQPSRQRGKFRA